MSVEENQWLEKTILASTFKDKLIELGEDDFVKYTEKVTRKAIIDRITKGCANK